MRSLANSSGSLILGDPVLRQKMMSTVAARRRRFTVVVLAAVCVCACLCGAAVLGSLGATEETAAGDAHVRLLKTPKEDLLVPTHRLTSARARR
jgi:hypothetical protein